MVESRHPSSRAIAVRRTGRAFRKLESPGGLPESTASILLLRRWRLEQLTLGAQNPYEKQTQRERET